VVSWDILLSLAWLVAVALTVLQANLSLVFLPPFLTVRFLPKAMDLPLATPVTPVLPLSSSKLLVLTVRVALPLLVLLPMLLAPVLPLALLLLLLPALPVLALLLPTAPLLLVPLALVLLLVLPPPALLVPSLLVTLLSRALRSPTLRLWTRSRCLVKLST
jgi:hypothetical protein